MYNRDKGFDFFSLFFMKFSYMRYARIFQGHILNLFVCKALAPRRDSSIGAMPIGRNQKIDGKGGYNK